MNEQEKQHDAVKRPSHYILEDGTEVKDHIRSILGDDGFKSWAIGNAIKYVSRYKDKGKPVQDLKKAQENIQMVIDALGEPHKFIVRSDVTDEDGDYWYVNMHRDMSSVWYRFENATRFNTREEAQEWANSHQVVVEIDENGNEV